MTLRPAGRTRTGPALSLGINNEDLSSVICLTALPPSPKKAKQERGLSCFVFSEIGATYGAVVP